MSTSDWGVMRASWCSLIYVDSNVNPASRWLLVGVTVFFLNGIALAKCKAEPVLAVSYQGVGMVINGKHLYLLICRSGEVEYDNGEFQAASRRKRDRLTDKQQAEITTLVNDAGTRNLVGKYSGVVGVRDHAEWLDVTIFRPEGQQNFTVIDFYGDTKKSYPPPLVAFLCRIDRLRTKTDWHISVDLSCPVN